MAFRSIELGDRERFENYLGTHPQQVSELTFTNLFAWGPQRKYEFDEIDGHIVVKNENFLQPIGPEPAAVINRLIKGGTVFERVDSMVAEKVNCNKKHDMDNDDYIYDLSNLRLLPGQKYAPKRNFVHRVQKLEPSTEKIGHSNVIECLRVLDEWAKGRQEPTDAGAVRRILENLEHLKATGIAVRIEGKVVAFALSEPLNNTTHVDHAEKALQGIPGIYQYLNYELARSIPSRFKRLNREQDMGIRGLRKAKQSYHPEFMVEKYTIKN